MNYQEKIYNILTEGKPVRDPNAPLRGYAMDEIPRHTRPKGGFKPGGKPGEDERDLGRPVYRPRPGEDPTPPWRRKKIDPKNHPQIQKKINKEIKDTDKKGRR